MKEQKVMMLALLTLAAVIVLMLSRSYVVSEEKEPSNMLGEEIDNNSGGEHRERWHPVNPPDYSYHNYIWTPKDVYLVGEKVPLYIEVHNVPTSKVEYRYSVPDPFDKIFVYEESYEGFWGGYIPLWDEEKQHWARWTDHTRHYPLPCPLDRYIVKPEDVPANMPLHGRLKQLEKIEGVEIEGIKDEGYHHVILEPGESYVLRIDDITKFWYKWPDNCPPNPWMTEMPPPPPKDSRSKWVIPI